MSETNKNIEGTEKKQTVEDIKASETLEEQITEEENQLTEGKKQTVEDTENTEDTVEGTENTENTVEGTELLEDTEDPVENTENTEDTVESTEVLEDTTEETVGKPNKAKKFIKKHIYTILEIACVLVFLFSGFKIISIYRDYSVAETEYDSLSEQVLTVVESVNNEDETEEQSNTNDSSGSVFKQPFNYRVDKYEVDLDKLKEQNSDTVGWIILPDTKLSYPIVQSKDNNEYLTRTFEGQESTSGAIFIDKYCLRNFNSKNTIIYGHNMKNGTMFRALNDLPDKEYFWKHHIFCIDAGDGFREYDIISCYEADAMDYIPWAINFESNEAYNQWIDEIVSRSVHECTEASQYKNTITLSTCRGRSGGPGRFVVHLQERTMFNE